MEDERFRTALEHADDGIVAGRAMDGDVEAFAVLVRRYTPMMRAYTQRMLNASADVDDIVQGVTRAVDYALAHPGCYELLNLGESDTVTLSRLVELLARALGVEPRLRRLPPQPGDVERTCADVSRARDLLGYAPTTRIEQGIPLFVEWFRSTRTG